MGDTSIHQEGRAFGEVMGAWLTGAGGDSLSVWARTLGAGRDLAGATSSDCHRPWQSRKARLAGLGARFLPSPGLQPGLVHGASLQL